MEILAEDHFFYTLSRNTSAEYILETVCGTSAVFTITIKLTRAEIEKFESDPQSIRVLAQDIVDHPREYLNRRI